MRTADAKKPSQPLAEVFGHIVSDQTSKANRYRSLRLCPFNNKVPNCTKDKAKNPLGVCSIYHNCNLVITCPIRFREEWLITDDAASFFFDKDATWSSLTEVRLNDANGKTAGNIDVVLVAYDVDGRVYDFGALEIQAVYISGNVRDPFEYYMKDPSGHSHMDWTSQPNYPRPDFFFFPQTPGSTASFQERYPSQLAKEDHCGSEQGFLRYFAVYEKRGQERCRYCLDGLRSAAHRSMWPREVHSKKVEEIYTQFEASLQSITTPSPGKIDDFMKLLQDKLDEQLKLLWLIVLLKEFFNDCN